MCILLPLCFAAGCAAFPKADDPPEPPQETVDTPAEPDIPVVPAPEPEPEPAEDALVDVCTYLPGVYADLRYATENNFTGQVIYDFTQPQLRYGTLKKLAQAQEMLAERDLALKIWDAYRPVSAQFRLWEVCPDPQYVADPTKGYSGHSRGNTVDVTLVSADGSPVPMPTDFDDFTAMADRDYSDVSDTAAYDNVRMLEDTMVSCGFRPYEIIIFSNFLANTESVYIRKHNVQYRQINFRFLNTFQCFNSIVIFVYYIIIVFKINFK